MIEIPLQQVNIFDCNSNNSSPFRVLSIRGTYTLFYVIISCVSSHQQFPNVGKIKSKFQRMIFKMFHNTDLILPSDTSHKSSTKSKQLFHSEGTMHILTLDAFTHVVSHLEYFLFFSFNIIHSTNEVTLQSLHFFGVSQTISTHNNLS